MSATTHLRQLVDDRLGTRTLDDWVNERRTAGKSWRTIAHELETATDIHVGHANLHRWFTST